MKWPLFLTRLAYVLIAISFLGFGFAIEEGVRANFIKIYTPTPTLSHDSMPTDQELKLYRLESRKANQPYAIAKDHVSTGTLVGSAGMMLGIALAIIAEKAGSKKSSS